MEGLKETERTPQVIAGEIIAIKNQARKILLASAVEVGKRLVEAKEKLAHGEWLHWLEEAVGYSYRTAANLMKLYEVYGKNQEGLPNMQPVATLNYSQALILLGLPETEREQFIMEMDIENMSKRQLEKAVQERKEALENYSRAKAEEENLKKALKEQEQKMNSLIQERDKLKRKMEELSKAQAEAEAKAVNLSLQLKAQEQSTNAQAVERLNRNLNAAYQRAKANKIAFIYEQIERNLKDFFREIKDFKDKEVETYEIYRQKMTKLLSNGLAEKF